MKRRTVLAALAALPTAAADKKGKKKIRKLATNSVEYYEAQFLALFLALLSKDNRPGGKAKLDEFLNSNGKRDQTDTYFYYTTDQAFKHAYDLLKAGQFPSVIQFQDDFRKLSAAMVTYLAQLDGQTITDAYPMVCPRESNMKALLEQL